MNLPKFIFLGIISSIVLIFGMSFASFGLENFTHYEVKRGDTFWVISNKLGVSMDTLMVANKATQNTVLYEGQNILIPQKASFTTYTVQDGDSFWEISKKFSVDLNELIELNGGNGGMVIYKGQILKIPLEKIQTPSTPTEGTNQPSVTYTYYTILQSDTVWKIADKYGVPVTEIFKINNLNDTSTLYPGKILKIPVYSIPVKPTPEVMFGEYLDWWKEAQYVVKKDVVFEMVDFYTGKSFFAKRTTGTNHADIEALTTIDTNKMKEIWGGSFSWTRRPVIIKINGRKLAASATAMPHAGTDSFPGGIWTEFRSGGYGAGYNLDWIKGNGCEGHTDLHFLNSTRHMDGLLDLGHQASIKIAAGM